MAPPGDRVASAGRAARSIRPQAHELARDADLETLEETLASLRDELEELDGEHDAEERETMGWILEKYANGADAHGRTALFYLCNQNQAGTAELLLSPPFCADPNRLDPDGYPPIYIPCERGFASVVRLLLRFGADADHRVLLDDEDSNDEDSDDEERAARAPSVATPLLAAVLLEQEEIVRILLEHGADPNVVTDTELGKKSALEIAKEIAPNPAIRDLLLDHGATEEAGVCRLAEEASSSLAPPKLSFGTFSDAWLARSFPR